MGGKKCHELRPRHPVGLSLCLFNNQASVRFPAPAVSVVTQRCFGKAAAGCCRLSIRFLLQSSECNGQHPFVSFQSPPGQQSAGSEEAFAGQSASAEASVGTAVGCCLTSPGAHSHARGLHSSSASGYSCSRAGGLGAAAVGGFSQGHGAAFISPNPTKRRRMPPFPTHAGGPLVNPKLTVTSHTLQDRCLWLCFSIIWGVRTTWSKATPLRAFLLLGFGQKNLCCGESRALSR